MTPFKAPLDDILLSLSLATEGVEIHDYDAELAGEIIGHFAAFAEGVIAPTDESGDREGCHLEHGRVQMPAGFKDAYDQLAEGGWQGLTLPEEFGGMGQNALVNAGCSEIFTAANPSLQMVTSLAAGAARTIQHFGNDMQKDAWIPRLASGELLATMCLTEPGAGSDLARIRTKAARNGDGWTITGEKIFISGGDQDLSVGILHLVLARTGSPEDGVKGLSLFLCPAVDSTVSVTRIEEKMGLHASPTCQLAFDGAAAKLLGKEGSGLMAMFTMMNHARLDVGLQGVAHAARAADIAATYAAERKQGGGSGGSATIDQYPAVRAMLDEQQALAKGARLMCHTAMVALETGNSALAEFLTPVCKVFGTRAGIRAADLGIQVLGGYGYLKEYRVEQTWRDARICAIYEGTNEIHALTLATRLLRLDNGACADAYEAHVAGQVPDDNLARWRDLRAEVANAVDPAELAEDFMQATGLLAWQAAWAKLRGTGVENARLADWVDRKVARALP